MQVEQLPAPPKNWWGRNKGRIAAGALIGFGLAVALGAMEDFSAPRAIDHQVGYVAPEVTAVIVQVATENPATVRESCQELRTGPYDEALAVSKDRAAAHGLSDAYAVQALDALINWCRSH